MGVIGLLTAAASGLTFLPWGVVADRFGTSTPLRLGSAIGLMGLIVYALAPNVAALWIAAVAIGASNAASEVGVIATISAQTPLAARSPAMSGWNAVAGVRGLVASFTISTLVQTGLLDVTAGLLVCAAGAAAGAVLLWRIASPLRRAGRQEARP